MCGIMRVVGKIFNEGGFKKKKKKKYIYIYIYIYMKSCITLRVAETHDSRKNDFGDTWMLTYLTS
jgi:hypothetical protein